MSSNPFEQDAKRVRVKTIPPETHCRVCHGKSKPEKGHSIECPLASMADAKIEIYRAKEREQWARDRAAYWLGEVRLMHGKLAALKAEIQKLRRKTKTGTPHSGPALHYVCDEGNPSHPGVYWVLSCRGEMVSGEALWNGQMWCFNVAKENCMYGKPYPDEVIAWADSEPRPAKETDAIERRIQQLPAHVRDAISQGIAKQ